MNFYEKVYEKAYGRIAEIARSYEVEFKPTGVVWITSWLYSTLLEARSSCITVSLDMGISKHRVCINSSGLVRVEGLELEFPLQHSRPSSDDRVVVIEDADRIYEVSKRTNKGFYKLKAIGPFKAPTLEISGIHMHRIVDIDPWLDSRLKVLEARVGRNDAVLDTCTGLGYTAIHSVLRGAGLVVTAEVDDNVVWIAERNPWSRRLADSRIVKLGVDITKAVRELPSEFFDRIIHDPPRLASASGELYSLDFYKELYRVLRPRGILYCYTGEPGRHGGPRIVKGVGERLRMAGFEVRFSRRTLGFVAFKRS